MTENVLAVCTPERDTARAEWVRRNCSGPLWTLYRSIPCGFERYARILHPWWRLAAATTEEELAFRRSGGVDHSDLDLTPVRWKDQADKMGVQLTATSLWDDFASSDTLSIDKFDELIATGNAGIIPPYEGELSRDIGEAIFTAVSAFSGEACECMCAFWEGFPDVSAIDAPVINGMAQGEHRLFSATLAEVFKAWLSVLDQKICFAVTPQAIWPLSRDWFFAVPFEQTNSFFAGSAEFVDELLSSDALEALDVTNATSTRLSFL